MSSIGTGYDLSATTFSPDGRVFQVEYAAKAVENSGTAIGVRCKDGVVFAVEKIILSKLYEPESNPRNFTVDRHIGLAFSGLSADARQIVNRARSEATSYRNSYGVPISCKVLAERIAGFMQVYTLYSHIRPFGCSVLIGSYDDDGPHFYMVEPSGVSCGYHGCAVGKGRQAARTELEKMDLGKISCRDAITTLAKIIYTIHDDVKDKEFELELSWICEESGRRHQFVPEDIVKAAADQAKKAMEEDSDDNAGDGK